MIDPGFFRDVLTPILAVLGSLLGIVGTVLGILNYRLNKERQRVTVIVEPMTRLTTNNGAFESLELSLKIVNAGHIAVTIAEAGIVHGPKLWMKTYTPMNMEASLPTQRRPDLLPRRIEARDEFPLPRFYSSKRFFQFGKSSFPSLISARSAYVKTSTGEVFRGKGEQFKWFVELAKAKEGLVPATEWKASPAAPPPSP